MNKYYKAYEKRYKQMYELKELWEVSDKTPEVFNTTLKYNINKKSVESLDATIKEEIG